MTFNKNPWFFVSIILLIALIISVIHPSLLGNFISPYSKKLPPNQVGKIVVDYINKNSNANVELIDVKDNGLLYKITIDYNGQNVNVFATKDGKKLYLNEIDLSTQITREETPSNKVNVENLEYTHVRGNENASVTIIEFSDFQCPFCKRFFDLVLPQLEEEYIKTEKVKLVFKHFPLDFHIYAKKAAEASECAAEQGKFWEYHDILFKKQSEWSYAGESKLKEYAEELGLNISKFEECLKSEKYKGKVENDYNQGIKLEVSGTPTFFINGVKIVGAQPYSVFKQVIDRELEK